jgi:Ca2+-transporting ATPase
MKGLSTTQISQLLTKYGLNIITEQKKKSIFVKFFEQFNNFLMLTIFSFVIKPANNTDYKKYQK